MNQPIELTDDAKFALSWISGYPQSTLGKAAKPIMIYSGEMDGSHENFFSIPPATADEILKLAARLALPLLEPQPDAAELAQEVGQGDGVPEDKLSFDANLALAYLQKWPAVKLDADAKRLHLFSPDSSGDGFFSIPPTTVLELLRYAARAASAPEPVVGTVAVDAEYLAKLEAVPFMIQDMDIEVEGSDNNPHLSFQDRSRKLAPVEWSEARKICEALRDSRRAYLAAHPPAEPKSPGDEALEWLRNEMEWADENDLQNARFKQARAILSRADALTQTP